MPAPPPDQSSARIDELERQIADLRRRLAAMEEKFRQPRNEHPSDTQTIKEKVKFDWQS